MRKEKQNRLTCKNVATQATADKAVIVVYHQ